MSTNNILKTITSKGGEIAPSMASGILSNDTFQSYAIKYVKILYNKLKVFFSSCCSKDRTRKIYI